MSAAEATAKRKMGVGTLLSSIFLLVTIVMGLYTVLLVQGGLVRTQEPHEEYDDVEPWPYNIDDWAGGRSFWFDNINYSNVDLSEPPPDNLDLLANTTLFIVSPNNPPQLWRSSSYDAYDGQNWDKSDTTTVPFDAFITAADAMSQGNTIYTVTINVSAGPNIGSLEMPTLFPDIQIIEDSFTADPADRLISYTWETDAYGSLLFSPLVQGTPGEIVQITYDITYAEQDLDFVSDTALDGDSAPAGIRALYSDVGVSLSQNVTDEIALFQDIGDDAYDKAIAVDAYFKTAYDLMIAPDEYQERPGPGEELTEWFLNRGGGLPMDFSTAYCVFMRELGIPARPVVGYAIGDDMGTHRELMVKHMFFWAEVYIPMLGGGEWVQLFPIPGLNEVPENTGLGDVQLFVFPSTAHDNEPWVFIGEPFDLSAILLVDLVPTGTGELISFVDMTDGVPLGVRPIEEGTNFPSANITYTFPDTATAGPHNFTAVYQTSLGQTIGAYTWVYAVGTPDPLSKNADQEKILMEDDPDEAILADIIDVNVKLGFDNYTAYWQDTIHVHGLMTYLGVPIDGTTLENDQMEIWWDGFWYDNATIQSDGTYSLDIYADPFDIRMILDNHEVYSYYDGEDDPITGWPIYAPNNSSISTIEMWGKVDFNFQVDPQVTIPGATVSYNGTLTLLNGTQLSGKSIYFYFNDSQFDIQFTDGSGYFSSSHSLGVAHPLGVFPAYVNWTSDIPFVASNYSEIIPVFVSLDVTELSINSNPAPFGSAIVYNNITIWGWLTYENGTGIPDQDIDVFWQFENGTTINLGPVTTDATGFYYIIHLLEYEDEGLVTYWAEFTPTESGYTDAYSDILQITVRMWITEVTISVDPSPLHLNDIVTISGTVTIPEFPFGVPNANVTIWWNGVALPLTMTDGLGNFLTTYQIPLDHVFDNVPIYAEFLPIGNIGGNVSPTVFRQVTNYATYITANSDQIQYYLNQTAHIWGQLTSDGPVMGTYNVTMDWDWDNGTIFQFSTLTDALGNYDFYVPLSLEYSPTNASVLVRFTPLTRLFNESSDPITRQEFDLYDTRFTVALNATEYHLDEVLEFTVTLYFPDGMIPLRGASITIWYQDADGLNTPYVDTTDAAGAFTFLYNYSMVDTLGAIYIWAEYLSTDPFWKDAMSANETVDLIRYQFNLTITTAEYDYHLNKSIHVTGWLTYLHNGTPLQNQPIRMYWANTTLPVPFYQWYYTDATGYFEFFYNASMTQDSVNLVNITAEWTNANPMWDDATSSPHWINLQLYQFSLVINTNDTAGHFHLDEVSYVWGRLAYTANNVSLANQPIRVNWDGTNYQWYYTNASGYFEFYYNFTLADSTGPIAIYAEFINSNPLWDNGLSNTLNVLAQLYQFDVSISTNGSVTDYYLNQTVHVYGWLTYQDTGLPVSGQTMRIYWDHSLQVETFYEWYTTDGTGYFEFYYNLTTGDPVGSVTIVAGFLNSNPLWDNANSTPAGINLLRYQLEISATATSPVYLNQSVIIQGDVTFQGGTPAFGGATVNIYLLVDATWTYVDFVVTDASGHFQYLYWFTVPPDTAGLYQFKCNTSTGLLYEDVETVGTLDVTVQFYTVVLDATFLPATVYLNESISIYVHLYFLGNGTGIFNAPIDIIWNNGSDWTIQTVYTDINGEFTWIFDTFSEHTFLTGIDVFANYSGSLLSGWAQSNHTSVTLQRWQTEITGFNTSDTSRYPLETLNIYGNLHYIFGPSAYGGASVELVVDGTPQGVYAVTQSNGDFTIIWVVPVSLSTGGHDLTVRFVAAVNWIEDYTTPTPITITITRQELSWRSFTVTPDPVYRTQGVTISGYLDLNNGSPYAFAEVSIYWDHATDGTGEIWLVNVTTDASGYFVHVEITDASTPLGFTIIRVVCEPIHTYIDSDETAGEVTIERMPTSLAVSIDTDPAYVGDTVVFSGYLFLYDMTPLVGYDVNIVWQNGTMQAYIIGTDTTGASGFYTVTYIIPTRNPAGPSRFYAVFPDNDAVLLGNTTSDDFVDIMYSVELHFDEQTVFSVAHGDTLTISGYISDTFGNVPMTSYVIRANGIFVSSGYTDAADGTFSFDYLVPDTLPIGTYTITLEIPTPIDNYYDIIGTPDTWTVDVLVGSDVFVSFTTSGDTLVGETIGIRFRVTDDQDSVLVGVTVSIYLFDGTTNTLVGTWISSIGDTQIVMVIPDTLPSSGNYSARVEYLGSSTIAASSGETDIDDAIHLIKEVVFVNATPSFVYINGTFTAGCVVRDENGVLIQRRAMTLEIEGQTYSSTSNPDGQVSFSDMEAGPEERTITFTFTLLSDDVIPNPSEEFSIAVVPQPGLDALLIVIWIALIIVEIVVAGLVLTRFRRRRATSTTYIRPDTSVDVSTYHVSNSFRW